MGNVLKTRVVRIGNSRGVRIPKAMLGQLGITDEVEMEAGCGALVIRPARRPREGWDECFAAMHEAGDDQLLDEVTPTKWDEEEWQW